MNSDDFIFKLYEQMNNMKRIINCISESETSNNNVSMTPYYDINDMGEKAVKQISNYLQYTVDKKAFLEEVLKRPVKDGLCAAHTSHQKIVSALDNLTKINSSKPIQYEHFDHNLDEVLTYLKEDVSKSSTQEIKVINDVQNIQTLKQFLE